MGGSSHSQGALDELKHPRYDEVKDELLLPSKDNQIILLKLQTICIACLKATELTLVSNIQCWSENQFDLSSKDMSQIQLTKMFKVLQNFKSA
jgi:hypothetical protein